MEDYKDFTIHSDLNDDRTAVEISSQKYGITKPIVFGNNRLAKMYIDGYTDGINTNKNGK